MTDQKPNGGSAFPVAAGKQLYSDGMTLRDYFAGQALAGMVAALANDPSSDLRAFLTADCYLIADAMLEERNQ